MGFRGGGSPPVTIIRGGPGAPPVTFRNANKYFSMILIAMTTHNYISRHEHIAKSWARSVPRATTQAARSLLLRPT